MTTRRVLVTGATGFVGRHVIDSLVERGFEVHVVSRRAELPDGPAVARHRADLLVPGTGEALVESLRPTHLLHLAWEVAHGLFWTAPANLTWLSRSLDLLMAFATNGGQRVVMTGTCAEYAPSGEPLVERVSPVGPQTLYGVAKNALREAMEAAAAQFGLSAAWARLFYLYGPAETPARFVPAQIRAALQGKPVACLSPWLHRDYLHVADAAAAIAAILDSRVEGPVNVASGEATALQSIALCIAEAAGRKDLLLPAGAAPSGNVDRIVASVERLHAEVGFKPRLDLATGLRETVEWWRRNDVDAG